MGKKRKIICDCGNILEEKTADFEDIKTKAMVCPNCDYTTLTRSQAEDYIRLKELHDIIDSERNIIKVGNSMGLTLPEKMKTLGLKPGKKIKLEALSPNSVILNF